MEEESKIYRLIGLIVPLGFNILLVYFTVRSRSIDYVSFAFAYVDLVPIYIGIYGVFLAFLSAGVMFPPKDTSISSRLMCWAIAVVQIGAILETSEAFVRIKASLGMPIVDAFEITTQTGAISGAFYVAIMSFLLGITAYTVGGPGRLYELFSSSRRGKRGRDMADKVSTDRD
jgi:hypothetical protein